MVYSLKMVNQNNIVALFKNSKKLKKLHNEANDTLTLMEWALFFKFLESKQEECEKRGDIKLKNEIFNLKNELKSSSKSFLVRWGASDWVQKLIDTGVLLQDNLYGGRKKASTGLITILKDLDYRDESLSSKDIDNELPEVVALIDDVPSQSQPHRFKP